MTLAASEIRSLLRNASVLSALPEAALEGLLIRAHTVRYSKGAPIYRRGDPGDSLMVILAGRVKITNLTADGREIGLNFLGPGDLNGELAALDGKPRSANATALEATEALVLWRRDLIPVLKEHPDAMLAIIGALAGKVRSMSIAIEDSGLDLLAKAAGALLRLCEQHGRAVEDGIRIDLRLSQRELGNFAGLSRENMNRQLGELRIAELIRVEGGEIVVLDLKGLELAAARPI